MHRIKMNVKEENICRLCLNVAGNEFEIIDEIIKKMLDVLLFRANLNISKDPIICKDCTELVKKSFYFKTACNDTEEVILPFAINKNGSTFELKDIYKDEKDIEDVDDDYICRFCRSRLKEHNFILLETLIKDVMISKMLPVIMPNMNLNIKNPVICTSCTHNLDCCIKFVETCRDTDEKISKYCQNKGSFVPGHVILGDVLNFLKLGDNIQTHAIKQEVDTLAEGLAESQSELYNDNFVKVEAFGIEDEVVDSNESVTENISGVHVFEYDSCKESSQTNKLLHKDNMKMARYKCLMCTYVTKQKSSLKRHTLVHKDSTEVDMYKCQMCTFMTKHKLSLKNHMLIHKDIKEVKCTMCTYETKRKSDLKNHMLIHKDITELTMYKCTMCTHETKQKGSLKRHMLIHEDTKEVELFKCLICTFKTKHKRSLNGHMLIHKDIMQLEMYKCSLCSFQTKHSRGLKIHMLIHKDVTEVKMYECSMCTFQTKYKRSLHLHKLIHKDITEVEMHKCSMCTYETKSKSNLKRHMLIHQDITEVEMHKCSMCTYETKNKRNLKRHNKLVHKDIAYVEICKCECSFKTESINVTPILGDTNTNL